MRKRIPGYLVCATPCIVAQKQFCILSPSLLPSLPPSLPQRIEPSHANANGSNAGDGAGRETSRPGRRPPAPMRGGRGPGTPGGGGGGGSGPRGRGGSFSYEPWAGWVLENYSLYTTVLAAFTRKAANMSLKVRDNFTGCRLSLG